MLGHDFADELFNQLEAQIGDGRILQFKIKFVTVKSRCVFVHETGKMTIVYFSKRLLGLFKYNQKDD